MLLILDFTLGVLKELDSKGISWGALLTAILLWNKLMRNKEFKARDERVERNQKRIMIHLGVEGEWSTPRKTLTQTALQSLRKWYFSLQAEIAQVFQLRRGSKMNRVNWATLVPSVVGTIKLILQPFGIDLTEVTDEKVNSIVNGAAALAAIIGVFMNHYKKGAADSGSATQRPTDSNSSV